MKSGTFFKLGDGYIVTDWNERYFVLDCKFILIFLKAKQKVLRYYLDEQTKDFARGIISLKDAVVSNIQDLKGREIAFSISTAPHPGGRQFFFAFKSI